MCTCSTCREVVSLRLPSDTCAAGTGSAEIGKIETIAIPHHMVQLYASTLSLIGGRHWKDTAVTFPTSLLSIPPKHLAARCGVFVYKSSHTCHPEVLSNELNQFVDLLEESIDARV